MACQFGKLKEMDDLFGTFSFRCFERADPQRDFDITTFKW
jgi:hypothetical protein